MDSNFVTQALSLKPGPAIQFTAITTDSRKITPGCLFIALSGDLFDGHDFIGQALKQGATGIICKAGTSTPKDSSAQFFEVPDTLHAIRRLAQVWRSKFSIPIACVAGSVGKTTTKELLASVLSGKWERVLKTQSSQNGYLGVAITLLELRRDHQAAVIEVGIDDVNAMRSHMEIIQPTAGILTTIGPEHLEKLIDLSTVAKEEAQALRAVDSRGGELAINLDDPWVAPLFKQLNASRLKYSYSLVIPNADVFGSYTGQELAVRFPDQSQVKFQVPLPGEHNALNLLGALALALALGATPQEMLSGLQSFKSAVGRSQIIWLPGESPVICDYYNANPSSMLAGLKLLLEVSKNKRKWACLGDMLELGPDEIQFHRDLADPILRENIDTVLLLGPRMAALEAELNFKNFKGSVLHFANHRELSAYLLANARRGDAILIKGSRSMRMEEVWKELEPHAKSHWSHSPA